MNPVSGEFATGWDRRGVLVGFALAALAPAPAFAARTPRILFVCRFGSVKSATARELLRKRARECGIGLEVSSRGIVPEGHLLPELRQRLIAEYGIDPAAEPLRTLHQPDLDQADIVVLFDSLPPHLRKPDVRDWTDQPSMLGEFERSMAYLKAHLEALLASLVKPPA